MPISPPVIERAIALRYPRIEGSAFTKAMSVFGQHLQGHGFIKETLQQISVNFKVTDPKTKLPDFTKPELELKHVFVFWNPEKTLCFRVFPDVISGNVFRMQTGGFDCLLNNAVEQFPVWCDIIGTHDFLLSLAYVDKFSEEHVKPYIKHFDSPHGPVERVDGLFSDDGILPPCKGYQLQTPIVQTFGLELQQDPPCMLQVSINIPTGLNQVVLHTEATSAFPPIDGAVGCSLKTAAKRIHDLTFDWFCSILTEDALDRFGIKRGEQNA